MVARIAMNDRTSDFATAYTARQGGGQDWSRRTGEVSDAVNAPPLISGDRLGQAYNRSPRPVSRPGDGGQ